MTAAACLPHGMLCRHMGSHSKAGRGHWLQRTRHPGRTGPQLSRDLPVVVGVAVSPKLPILMGPCGGAPAVAQPRDMHVSLSLLLVSAP